MTLGPKTAREEGQKRPDLYTAEGSIVLRPFLPTLSATAGAVCRRSSGVVA